MLSTPSVPSLVSITLTPMRRYPSELVYGQNVAPGLTPASADLFGHRDTTLEDLAADFAGWEFGWDPGRTGTVVVARSAGPEADGKSRVLTGSGDAIRSWLAR